MDTHWLSAGIELVTFPMKEGLYPLGHLATSFLFAFFIDGNQGQEHVCVAFAVCVQGKLRHSRVLTWILHMISAQIGGEVFLRKLKGADRILDGYQVWFGFNSLFT